VAADSSPPHVLEVRLGEPRADELLIWLRTPEGAQLFELREVVEGEPGPFLARALEAAVAEAGALGVQALELWLSPPELAARLGQAAADAALAVRVWPLRKPQTTVFTARDESELFGDADSGAPVPTSRAGRA
jgi:hypothetical protein